MKAILISIQPKWCELIADGRKTIEVRKTRPKIETPFKCYIYCTKNKTIADEYWGNRNGHIYIDNGKVIGEFVCDGATCCQAYYGEGGEKHLTNTFGIDLKRACLTEDELFNYIIGKHDEIGTGWLWHITAPKLYDKPRELGEFVKPCDWNYDCCTCKRAVYELTKAEAKLFYGCDREITRPPQSWCYVDELQ